ncbi:nicotinate mononucleotide-dependent phosphoribosyltransferase CobT [Methanopyrus sp.]
MKEVLPGVRALGDLRSAERVVERCSGGSTVMVCVIGSTEISRVPGISAAGKTPESTFHTPAGDVELIYYDRIVNAEEVPQNPAGAPSPAVITKAAVNLASIPFLTADAGAAVKPACPYIDLGGEVARDFRERPALSEETYERLLEFGKTLGKELTRDVDFLTVGESVPGGTTTAMAVMTALGYETSEKFASSSHDSPHDIKERVVREGLEAQGVEPGDLDAHEAIRRFGDPMMPAVIGIVHGSRVPVLLAGGTQMAPILAYLAEEGRLDPEWVFVGTTKYVVEDEDSDIEGLFRQVGDYVLFSADPGFSESKFRGFRLYEKGYVKEGVGAGGAQVAAALKTKGKITPEDVLKECERVYERWMDELS